MERMKGFEPSTFCMASEGGSGYTLPWAGHKETQARCDHGCQV